MDNEAEHAPPEILEPLPWVVGVQKPSFADDPWFVRFCHISAQIMMEYVDKHDGQTGSENSAGVE